jgi:hypothetical protein
VPFVDAPVALLHAVRVPGDLVVDQPGAEVLQVQPLAGGIGRQQDANRADVRGGLEGGFDCFPVVRVHAAIHGQQPVAARETLGRQDRFQPVLRGPVFRE